MLNHLNYSKPPSKTLAKYAESLYARKHECQFIPKEIIQLDGWHPLNNQCHSNVLILEAYGDGFSAVHGWLYLDFNSMTDFVRFIAHSVVCNADGKLIDVTPTFPGAGHYPFIKANIGSLEYEAILNALLKKFGSTDCLDLRVKIK